MKKLLLTSLLLASACKSRTTEVMVPAPAPVAASNAPGAATARAALDAFIGAVRAQDLQAMSAIWGNKDGPARDSKVFSREEMEQRELYLVRCLKHDRFRVLGESPAADNERVFSVELVRGTLTRVTDFYTARGADRWYVRTANMESVRDLCSMK